MTGEEAPVSGAGAPARDADAHAARIVEQLQAGVDREEAFRSLFDIYYRLVVRFFQGRGFSHDESQDLTQEVFYGVYRRIGTYRWEAPFAVWLLQIARNTARKRRRRGAAGKRSAEEVSLDSGDLDGGDVLLSDRQLARLWHGEEPLATIIDRERNRALRQAIEVLPERMGQCLRLWLNHDLSYGEIATVLRISPNTVKVQMFQARKRLRDMLAARFGTSPT